MKNEIKIHILKCGEIEVHKDMFLPRKEQNRFCFFKFIYSKKDKIRLPVYTYLIVHPKGIILVDTGWNIDIRYDEKRHQGLINSKLFKGYLPDGEDISTQIGKLGFRAKDIDYVILTNLDGDHASGVRLVKDAGKIIASEDEVKFSKKAKFRYPSHLLDGIKIETFKMEDSEYGPYKKSFDLFNDDSINLVSIPGHSKGTCGVLIKNNGRFVLLASDCVYGKESYEKLVLPAIKLGEYELKRSLKWIQDLSRDERCIGIFGSHNRELNTKKIII